MDHAGDTIDGEHGLRAPVVAFSREGTLQQDRQAAGGNPAPPGASKLIAPLIVGVATLIAVAGALAAVVLVSRALIGGMPW
jgi:hypothetical protein